MRLSENRLAEIAVELASKPKHEKVRALLYELLTAGLGAPAIRDGLSWYLAVAENRRPAKFRIAATLPTQLDPATSAEEALWAELDRLTPIFLARWQAIRAGAPLPATADGPSLLELCRELAYRMLSHCNFCPWNCRVDRMAATKFGACKLASASRVSSHFHHTGEELFYRGTEGSGTIFFTSCNMKCAFCQNGDISTDKENGEETDARTLAAMAWTLRREGCHNINWVGGEVVIHLHAIVDAIALLGRDFAPTPAELRRARRTKGDRFFSFDEMSDNAVYDRKFNAPMLWNSNFFMTPESMKILRVLTDVWLPDFKFGPGRCAMTLAGRGEHAILASFPALRCEELSRFELQIRSTTDLYHRRVHSGVPADTASRRERLMAISRGGW